MKKLLKVGISALVLMTMFCFLAGMACAEDLFDEVDLCDGKTQVQKQNVQHYAGPPATFVEAAGYYTVDNKPLQYGSLTYRRENTSEVTVYAYTPLATFASQANLKQGEMRRGFTTPNSMSAPYRLLFQADQHLLYTIYQGMPYYCVKQKYDYAMMPGDGIPPQEQSYYGLNIEYSADGVDYKKAEVEYSVTPKPVMFSLVYTEEHVAEIPKEANFIRLSISVAAQLGFEGALQDNSNEEPLCIYRVSFKNWEATSSPDPEPQPDPQPDPQPQPDPEPDPKPEPDDSSSGSSTEPPPSSSGDGDGSGGGEPVVPRPHKSSGRAPEGGGSYRDRGGPVTREDVHIDGERTPHPAGNETSPPDPVQPERDLTDETPSVIRRTIILEPDSAASSSAATLGDSASDYPSPPTVEHPFPPVQDAERGESGSSGGPDTVSNDAAVWIYMTLITGLCGLLIFRFIKNK